MGPGGTAQATSLLSLPTHLLKKNCWKGVKIIKYVPKWCLGSKKMGTFLGKYGNCCAVGFCNLFAHLILAACFFCFFLSQKLIYAEGVSLDNFEVLSMDSNIFWSLKVRQIWAKFCGKKPGGRIFLMLAWALRVFFAAAIFFGTGTESPNLQDYIWFLYHFLFFFSSN